ncbi:MAG: peptidylprolyl isomerase [Clostridia bacterium]|nr:peptidylprolyl isomerase [Clostridia bacterium]
MKKLIAAILLIAVILSAASCNIIINPPGTDTDSTDTEPAETEKEYPHSNMELAPLDAIVATTEKQSLTVSTFKYYFMDNYLTFLNQYYYFMSSYGLDDTIPLHDQKYLGDENERTWYDIFLEQGKSSFEQIVKFAEKALQDGMSLEEQDYKEIDDTLDMIEEAAKGYDLTFEGYMADYMGEGMTRERMREALIVRSLGYKYYEKLYYSPVFSDEQIEEEYVSGKGKYSLVDYYEATIKAIYDEEDSDEQAEQAKKAASDKAEALKKLVEEGTGFVDAYNTVVPVETEDQAAKESDLLNVAAGYYDEDKYEFMYEEGTTEGQISIFIDSVGNAHVVQCVKLPYKDTTNTINIRHILLDSSHYDTEEEAYAQAQKLLEQINAAADKKAEFISLVSEYSSDTGSASNGGLYENVRPGDMVTEFNDWCFDSERQVGDTDIVQTTFGYHVMYFDGFAGEVWKVSCETDLRDEQFTKNSNEIYESITVTYNEDLIDRIVK